MSDSENRLEHLQIENGMTNESPGNIERAGGSEVAEDQPARGEENNILEDEHGLFRRHREDPNSNIGYQEGSASNIGRLEDPLRNIGPDRHQFEEDPTRREARFPVRTRDPFSYEDPTRREARFPMRTRDPLSHEDPTRREARFPVRTLDPFRTLGVQEDSVRPEEPFHVHNDQSRYRWKQEDSWPQNTDSAGHYGNFSGRENWFPMYHQMEQFMNWRSGQRGDMEMPQLTRYEMPYQSRESDPFRKLQEAEEDREIALNLFKKVEENLDLIADSEEKLHEKRDALARGIKRLEEKTTTVEMWQKKTKLPLAERMTKLEIYEEQSIRFNSIRQMNQKIAKIGTSEILQRRENPPSSTVKLPKMELKTFDGNVLNGTSFGRILNIVYITSPWYRNYRSFHTSRVA